MHRLRLTIFVIGLFLASNGRQVIDREVSAQNSTSTALASSGSGAPGLQLQRSLAIYNYKTTAPSGPQRGEEIYYIKCWYCHNKYTITTPRGAPAPSLHGLYKRLVDDETVAEKIRNGGLAMPAYRHTMSDADLADLISYLKDDKCCFEGDEPPRNPWYRY